MTFVAENWMPASSLKYACTGMIPLILHLPVTILNQVI